MKKFNLILLAVLLSASLIGCRKKIINMNNEEKEAMLIFFSQEYHEYNELEEPYIGFVDTNHDYYHNEKLIVESDYQEQYYSRTGIYEIICYYDKETKRWKYDGYTCLESQKKLDILGEWEFEVFSGFFKSRYDGIMDIKEIKDNKVRIITKEKDNPKDTEIQNWYNITAIKPTDIFPENCYIIDNIIISQVPDSREHDQTYKLIISSDKIHAENKFWYKRSYPQRISTYTENNTIY